jgi:hypothetical protein
MRTGADWSNWSRLARRIADWRTQVIEMEALLRQSASSASVFAGGVQANWRRLAEQTGLAKLKPERWFPMRFDSPSVTT